ncbi:hypothetical protein EJ02DRAFT_369783 [Clathrospora elynae]|uniref:Rhodopsin domain-containing protein n=1 Tax=Clathrospora elynae TaxID=706981 RepID=A0A6A5T3N9_9PLEO|nr:hypothetical protein EJ02DRAFT_369783 [Clathrospora elynae]
MAPNVGLGTQGPVQRGWGLWLTSVLTIIIAGLFVSARLLQRFVKQIGLGIDDWMIILALGSSVMLSVTEIQAVVHGYGRHFDTLSLDDSMTARKWFYVANVIYKLVLMLTKFSVVCVYYRIFGITRKSFRIACYVMGVWILVSGVGFVVATIVQCTPIAAFWEKDIPGSRCFNNEPWWVSYAVTQIVTDFMLLVMPIGQILKLSMGKVEKLGLILVFGTGGFVTFTSIYRATTLAKSSSVVDPTWDPIPATVWTVIESNAGIVCASLPMLRGPFLRGLGSVFGSRLSSKSESYKMPIRNDPKTDNNNIISHTCSDMERGSEDEIIKDDVFPDSRGNNIYVTNEFGVVEDELERRKRSDASSEDGKSVFFHV